MAASESLSTQRFFTVCATLCTLLAGSILVGCADDTAAVRAIQARRQEKLQSENKQDHIGDTYQLLTSLVELNREKANRQIVYHLNQWRQERSVDVDKSVTPLIKTISEFLPAEQVQDNVQNDAYLTSDIDHLRDCYLFRKIVQWIDTEKNDDPLLKDWHAETSKQLDESQQDQLRTACRIFDWCMRNISYEPATAQPAPPQVPRPALEFGMELGGIGYRQTDYQTIWRGTGDWLQRSGVFTQLCRQASVPAAILATQSTDTGELTPWCVGVLVGQEVYLFAPQYGSFIPGPDQVGIATLKDARRDAAVTRRLGVAGFDEFAAPVTKDQIQQNVALLNLSPEAISPRMRTLQSGLTGERRMQTFADADAEATAWDDASGIAGVQLWKMPLLADVYAEAMKVQTNREPLFAIWHLANWAILDGDADMSVKLSKARWLHMHGKFASNESENFEGATTLYMGQRAPEFEIEDLQFDVDLQKKWFRRELGLSPQQYRQQLAQIQTMMKMGKRTASYWLSLAQYDDGRIENANNWLTKRVLPKNQASPWQPAARYNLARALELMGDPDKAIELYKTSGDPQEHGNRIRARLLAKSSSK